MVKPPTTPAFWHNKRVFLTGHTGFKGSWLALWLAQLGAKVTGFALPPATTPSLFEAAGIGQALDSIIGDIRDTDALRQALLRSKPEIILHMAAQALVSEGYRDPVGTYATNVMGTINLLEQARHLPELRVMVIVTTDKCYENLETERAYTEADALGGHDPYSSSKACAEIVTASWRRAFFLPVGQVAIATARAGNVIGGGDWAPYRLVPDLVRAFAAGETAKLRNAHAVRPWQHVLEPLAGYLTLAEQLWDNPKLASAWNFGPELQDCVSVLELTQRLSALWPGGGRYSTEPSPLPHEAGLLRLDASRAHQLLNWRPRWRLDEALRQTVAWHLAWLSGSSMSEVCRQQIDTYCGTPA